MVYFINKRWNNINSKKLWWKIKRKSKKRFKMFTNFKKVINNKLKFKSLRWFYKRYMTIKNVWKNYLGISKKETLKFKSILQATNIRYKQRQATKNILYFDFIYGRKLDILIAGFFGGTLTQARKIIFNKEILINSYIISSKNYLIKFGDFIQIEPTRYFTLLKYKHFLHNWKKFNYKGYLLNTNLMGILFNQTLNKGVIIHFKIWQNWIRRQDAWQTALTKSQSRIITIKNINISYLK